MRAFLRRLVALLRRKRLEREIDDELGFHVAMRGGEVAPNGGAAPRFGNALQIKEEARDAWTLRSLEGMLLDARHAVRTLHRRPGFVAPIVLTLALGIGLTTVVFSVFQAVILRPLDYPDQDRLVWLTLAGGGLPLIQERVTNLHVLDWEEHSTSFERFVAYNAYDQTLAAPGLATRARVAAVSNPFWDIAGTGAAVGRLPQPGDRDVVVLTYSFYTRVFAEDASVVGKVATLDRRQVTVIGVLPPGFDFQFPTPIRLGFRSKDVDLYGVLELPGRDAKFVQFVNVIGRLKSDASLESARTEVESLVARASQGDPTFVGATLQASLLHDRLVRDNRTALTVLLVAVGFVSLIACANVATLLMARAFAREGELAVRVAIGASGPQLFRQHLIETLILLGLGAGAGLLLAFWALATAKSVSLGSIPRLSEAAIDSDVVGGVAIASILVAAALAAVSSQVTRRSRLPTTKNGQPGVQRVRPMLVTAQIALALMLLTGAGLMVRSWLRLNDFPTGFHPDRILAVRADFPGQPSRAEKRRITDEVLRRVNALPGITAATINSQGDRLSVVNVEGVPRPSPETAQAPVSLNMTSGSFATVMGLRMVRGRWFTDSEPQPVVVVNHSLAARVFGRVDPVGRRLQIPSTTGLPADVRFAPIVGVVADLKYTKLDEAAPEEIFVPYTHVTDHVRIRLLIGTERDPLALVPSIRQVVSDVTGGQVPSEIMTLEDALADSIRPRRFNLLLLGTFSGAGLLLSLTGLYGLMAYAVTRRTHEIGIRMALGAQRRDVLAMVMRQGLRLTVAGVCIGAGAAMVLTRVMVSMLYEVAPTDLPTFFATTALLVLTALTACVVPATRAAGVDPIRALRHE
jgi:putative ABC transport system permease protein